MKCGDVEVVRDPHRFLECLRAGKKDIVVENVYGRVTKGKEPKHFEKLATQDWKRLAWVMGPDSLVDLIGMSPLQISEYCGMMPGWVKGYLDSGYEFKIVFFSPIKKDTTQRADWDGMLSLVEQTYPEVWDTKIKEWTEDLKTKEWSYFEEKADYNFLEVSQKGENDDRFVSAERLAEQESSLLNARAFLYFQIGAKELYAGDGFTYSTKGERGTPEYLTVNFPLELTPHCFHPLEFNFL